MNANTIGAHVRAGVSRVRGYEFVPDAVTDLGALPVLSSPHVPDGRWLLAGGVVFVGEYDEVASECIAAELVACTLGQRVRPELQVSPIGFLRGRLEYLRERVGEALAKRASVADAG